MNTDPYETYGSGNLRVEFMDDEKEKKVKITCYLKICMITGLVTMTVIKVCLFGMGKKCGYQNRQLEENEKKVKD